MDDERGVGPEHHHFAVRHVDDAHHAEGYGEADRGKQQDRAERESVPGVLQRGPKRKAVLDRRDGVGRGLLDGGRGVRRQSAEERERVLIPALADDGDGVDLVGIRCIVEIEHDRGARLGQRLLHLRVALLGDGLLERRQRVRVLGFEHGLRCLEALSGVGRHQGQAAERRLDDPSQAVVEAHRRKVGGRAAGDRFAGCGVDQAVGGRLANENALAVGAEKQAPLLQGADDRCGERVAASGNRVDTLDRVVEAVGREAEKPILVGSGARRRHHGGEHAKRTHERDEAIAEGTHPDRPGISERGGPISAIRWAASIPATNATVFYPDNATTRHRTSWSPYCSCRI